MLRWMRSRRQLLAELVEAREQCVLRDQMLARAIEQRDHNIDLLEKAYDHCDNACRQRNAAVKQRDDAWAELSALQGGLVKDNIRDYRPLSLRTELLRERARADQLAALVERLQEANMRADCMHGTPIQEAAAVV